MKLLIITNSYPDHADSYRGVFVRKLGLELIHQGLDVVVVTPRVFRQSPRFENDRGIRVHRFWYPSGDKPLGQSGAIPLVPMIIYMLSGFCKAVSVIWSERPNVIHGNWIVPTGLIAAVAGRLLQVPVINSAHGMDVRVGARGPVGLLFDLAVALSSAVTVVSEAMKNRRMLGQAEVIPFGVDEGFFAVHPIQGERCIISTRSLEPVYDLETLIRAVPLVLKASPESKFTIIGQGSQMAMLQTLAAQLGVSDHIEFVGRLENTEIPRYMSRAKVYVSTSLTDGTSISLLEAQAAGLIPVVTDIEANRPWVKHGEEGFLFPSGDSQALADQILQALDGRISAAVLDNTRTRMKETVAWPRIATRYITLYRACLKPPRHH